LVSVCATACKKSPPPTNAQIRAVTRELVQAARNASGGRAEVGMHVEIESHSGMDSSAVGQAFAATLDTVPYAVGVNNHEGSQGTSDPTLMNELMPLLRERKRFFVDGRTSAATVAETAAHTAGFRQPRGTCFWTMGIRPTPSEDNWRWPFVMPAKKTPRWQLAIPIAKPCKSSPKYFQRSLSVRASSSFLLPISYIKVEHEV
jgi:hypothetical protein